MSREMLAAVVAAAMTSEDEIAHGEAVYERDGEIIHTAECAYDDEAWPCRTQQGIDRLLQQVKALGSVDQ